MNPLLPLFWNRSDVFLVPPFAAPASHAPPERRKNARRSGYVTTVRRSDALAMVTDHPFRNSGIPQLGRNCWRVEPARRAAAARGPDLDAMLVLEPEGKGPLRQPLFRFLASLTASAPA
jgi:hypothetical protein